MTSRRGGEKGILNPHHGFATSKGKDLYHLTLHYRTVVNRVAGVQKVWLHPQTLHPNPQVPCPMTVRNQFPLSHPSAETGGRLPLSNPQTIQRQMKKPGLARNNFERSVVCCLPE